jgi:von Willebrand factor type A domain
MSRFNGRLSQLLLLSALAGCGFSPGEAAPPTGAGGSIGSNTGGSTGVGASSGVGSSSGIGLSSGAGGDVSMPTSCGQTNVPIEAVPPDVLIIQDKSGSMDEDDTGSNCKNGCGANSKWSQVSAALTQVVMNTDSQINWGLKFFSDNNACSASGMPVVGVGANNGPMISTQIGKTSPGGNTPTRDAVTTGASYLSTLTDTNPKYILLATDGLPNCPVGCATQSNPTGSCTTTDNPSEDAAATMAIANALSGGIKTFVIGVGNVDVAKNTLNGFATAGGLPQSGAATQYYAATDPTALEAALNALVGAVFSCTVSLSGAPTGFSNVAVSAVDASTNKPVAIPQDPNNGWSYDAGKQNILLKGTACDNLKNGTYKDLNFIYACDTTTICIDRNPDGSCSDHTM